MPRGRGKSQEKKEAVYRFLIEYKKAHDGCAPSVNEIVEGAELRSTSHAKFLLERLAEEDKIVIGRTYRTIYIIGARWIPPEMEA